MAERFTFPEMADMYLIYVWCNSNSSAAVTRYRQEFPNKRTPSRKMFDNIDRRLRATGTFYKTNRNAGRQRFTRNVNVEERVLNRVWEDPTLSTRRLGMLDNISQSSVWRILYEQTLYPFHAVKVQELLPTDFQKRLKFCRSMLQKHRDDLLFFKRILFTDESCFTKCGIFNLRNHHEWAVANPRATVTRHSQFRFKINYWVGILGNNVLGAVELPKMGNTRIYISNIQDLLNDIALQDRFGNGWRKITQKDGLGVEAPQLWPPRSPDLNPLDCYLRVLNIDDLRERVNINILRIKLSVDVLEKLRFNFLKRSRACIRANGGH
ncbi:hypothetical protein NQ318_003978 [Aromia moschata]|uniref:DUF4817 domain-containing protein n=1 Tax=Aromia moschata TaxID=1265417 RepID=A0AAV8ZAQ2_9CUCU|nr:hypothetical protein NQ318_003978 [Aromia moschata]